METIVGILPTGPHDRGRSGDGLGGARRRGTRPRRHLHSAAHRRPGFRICTEQRLDPHDQDVHAGRDPAGREFALVIQNNCRRYGDDQLWRLGSSQTVNGAVYLQNKFSGKCLEVINYGVNYGDPVGQYTCYEGTNQLWRMRWNYQYGYAQFENVNSGLCLSVAGLSTTAFTAIVQNHCYTWATNEQFAPITQS
jgi:hypothetical protein